jgi:hypothetical protein
VRATSHLSRSVPQPQIGDGFQAGADLEERALWILLAIEAGLLMVFLSLAISLLW